MSSSNPTLSDMQHAVRDTVRLHWQLFLTQGVIMVILGVLAVVWPQISTIAVDAYVGWVFLLSGIVGLASMFLAPNVQAFLWSLLTAALSLFVGILLLWHPVEGAVSLTLVLIAFFIVEGIFQIVASLAIATCSQMRGDGCLLHDPLQLSLDFPLLRIGGNLGECFGRRAQAPQTDA